MGVLLLDQLAKLLVRRTLAVGQAYPGADTILGRGFSFTRVSNTGIAFGMFQGRNDVLVATSLLVVAAILIYRQRSASTDRRLQMALGLQVGGALGNVIDRLTIGNVTDFLDFKVWPVFNFSDLAIFSGVVIFAWLLWEEDKRTSTSPAEPAGSAEGPGNAVDAASTGQPDAPLPEAAKVGPRELNQARLDHVHHRLSPAADEQGE